MSSLTRFTETLLPLLLFAGLHAAIYQENVKGLTGGAVLLRCNFSEQLSENVSIYWKDKDDNSVLDINIIKNVPKHSSPKFRDRVESFPDLYKTGNFSIVLKKVEQTDSGPYDCHIPSRFYQQRTVLSVSGKRVEGAATSPPGPSGDAAATTDSFHVMLLPLLCLVV